MKPFPLLKLLFSCFSIFVFACWQNLEEGDRVGSTSVTTGNPTGLKISLKNNKSPFTINGRMDIYAATQIPVPGFSSLPLSSVTLVNAKEIILDSQFFSSVPDSLWPKTSIEVDSIYRFNAVITGDSMGAILKGFGYLKLSRGFVLPPEESKRIKENIYLVNSELMPLVEIKCSLDPETLLDEKDHYFFLYGTGYVAKGDNGKFTFDAVPKGAYEPYLLSIWKKGKGLASASDSAGVYGMNTNIEATRINELSVKSIHERIRLPDSLRQN